MSHNRFPVEAVRAGIQAIPQTVAQQSTEPPPPHEIYVVPGHEKALNPDTTVVVGDRGSGKSFWSAALNGDHTRALIGRQLRRLELDRVSVSWGFSATENIEDHPSRRVLRQLLRNNFEAEDIWRAVIDHQLVARYGGRIEADNWSERVRLAAELPEDEERILGKIDEGLFGREIRHVIIFDALDRSGDDWRGIRDLVRGLLRVCLDLRGYRQIRTKLFMRPDMYDDRTIWTFPDASKLQHGVVRLEWRRVDLYGLLWHWLANHSESGEAFRAWCTRRYRLHFDVIETGGITVYGVPKPLRTDENRQKELLEDMASPHMGRDRRRGRTYTWLPNHLADAKGQVSPRSFLLAVKRAEAMSQERGGDYVLHWEGIKQGVQQASRVRLEELHEEYPWIETVLGPLRGMTVPCSECELISRWRERRVLDEIERRQLAADEEKTYLAPHAIADQRPGEREAGLVSALIEIGVVSRMTDGRLNIPDLFRVAGGIGRKGGVRPIR